MLINHTGDVGSSTQPACFYRLYLVFCTAAAGDVFHLYFLVYSFFHSLSLQVWMHCEDDHFLFRLRDVLMSKCIFIQQKRGTCVYGNKIWTICFCLTSTGVLHHQVERPLRLDHFKKLDYKREREKKKRGKLKIQLCLKMEEIQTETVMNSWTQTANMFPNRHLETEEGSEATCVSWPCEHSVEPSRAALSVYCTVRKLFFTAVCRAPRYKGAMCDERLRAALLNIDEVGRRQWARVYVRVCVRAGERLLSLW